MLAWREVEEEPFEDDGDFFEVARRSAHVAPLLAVRPGEVVFRCWMPLPRQSSPTRGTLRQLLEGERLVIHYFSSDGSYQETSFALEGAAGAIGAALDVPLEPSAADHLQDELLALRVHYRGQTCYLLAGKKSRKRCLEAVTECGRRSHDSVVSMLNCIEVE